MTLYDFANQYGSEPLTKPWQANTQGCIFLLLVLCFTKLTVAEISNYFIEEHLVASVWMRKKMAQVRWWMRWWHYFSSDSEIQVHAEKLNLIEAFPCWWIGHGFATPPSPVLWPLCSYIGFCCKRGKNAAMVFHFQKQHEKVLNVRDVYQWARQLKMWTEWRNLSLKQNNHNLWSCWHFGNFIWVREFWETVRKCIGLPQNLCPSCWVRGRRRLLWS
jgi:hypothetical protein